MADNRLPSLSKTEQLILELLIASGEAYGLEIVKRSGGKVARGSVYVLLDRMEDKGYVSSREADAPPTGGLPRRIYQPTGLGQRVLRIYRELDALRRVPSLRPRPA